MTRSKRLTAPLVGVLAAAALSPWMGDTAAANQDWKLVDSANEMGSPALALVKAKQTRPGNLKIVAAASPKQPMIIGWGWQCTNARGEKQSRHGKRQVLARTALTLKMANRNNCTVMATARLERRIKNKAVPGRGAVKLLLYMSIRRR